MPSFPMELQNVTTKKGSTWFPMLGIWCHDQLCLRPATSRSQLRPHVAVRGIQTCCTVETTSSRLLDDGVEEGKNLLWPAPQPSPICLPAASSAGLTLRNKMEGGRYLCGTGLDVERNGWFRSSDVFVPDGGSTSSCSGIS